MLPKNWRTWLAWGAPLWMAANLLFVSLMSSSISDWWCGPPDEEVCNFAAHHPVIFPYLRISLFGMAALVLAAAILAIKRRLTKWGWAGFTVSLVIALLTGMAVLLSS